MQIFGLVGEKGAGKQTFVNFITQIASSSSTDAQGSRNDKGEVLKVRQIRFSDILAQTLIMWDIPLTRANLQKLAVQMSETFGQTALAKAAIFSIEGDSADIIIFDGVRREAEARLVRSFKDSVLIYITASQKLRYQRLKARSEKVGEAGLTFEQFLEEEKSKAEKEIPKISKKADIRIENNGSLEEFKAQIKSLNLLKQ